MNIISPRSRQTSLERQTFRTSRLLDFCSERELAKQIGHFVDQWPLAILKELIDNAIDAAEEADIAPVEFLLRQRVELNALPSDRLIRFIEKKLRQHGVKKVVPSRDTLGDAFRLYVRNREIERVINHELKKMNGSTGVKPPSNLTMRVRQHLNAHPEMRWDEAVSEIAAASVRDKSPKKRQRK